MDFIKLGPFVFKLEMLVLILSVITVFIVLKLLLKKDNNLQKEFSDALLNSLLILLVVYKSSIIIFNPAIFISYPLSVLYYNGGVKGIVVGLIAVTVYFIIKIKRSNWEIKTAIRMLLYTVIIFATSYWLFITISVIIIKLF